MSEKLLRFESSLPESSFNLVKQAAELTGMTVKSFVAHSVYRSAMDLLKEKEMYVPFSKEEKILLSHDAFEKVIELINHPEKFEEANKRLQAHKSKFNYSETERIE